MKPRILLGHAGGAGTAAAIGWLAREFDADVVTLSVDVGQGRSLDGVHERALALGALRAHVVDAREAFARDFILPALRADAWQGGRVPLVRPLARAVIAERLVEIARIEGASMIAHGDHRIDVEPSFETLIGAIDGDLEVVAPLRLAAERGEPLPGGESPAIDANLWGRSIASALVEDPAEEPPEDLYLLTKAAAETPDQPAYVEIAFERGVPQAINGVEMSLVELIQSLETIAGAHGVGRLDGIEHHRSGRNTRVLCEAPAAMALHTAHSELQRLVISRDVDRLASDAAIKYTDLASTGLWFTPARRALDALVNEVQQRVSGVVRLRLHKADCRVVSREARVEDSAPAPGPRAVREARKIRPAGKRGR